MRELPQFRVPAGADTSDPLVVADVAIGYADAIAVQYRDEKDVRDLCAEQAERNAQERDAWLARIAEQRGRNE
jgi:hypothetical protein